MFSVKFKLRVLIYIILFIMSRLVLGRVKGVGIGYCRL